MAICFLGCGGSGWHAYFELWPLPDMDRALFHPPTAAWLGKAFAATTLAAFRGCYRRSNALRMKDNGKVFADPQILARGMVVEVRHARAGGQKTLGQHDAELKKKRSKGEKSWSAPQESSQRSR